jgi:hypothetical protein
VDCQLILVDARFAPRVIDGGRIDASGVPEPPLTRPGDRLEGWPATRAVVLRMHAAAERSSVASPTAFAIVVERALIERDLEQRGLAQRAGDLDAIAVRATVKTPISDGLSEYLRVLYDHRAEVGAPPPLVPIPMRLTERISAAVLDELLNPDLFPSALRWERAAAVSGLTMTEWAAFALLDLVSD